MIDSLKPLTLKKLEKKISEFIVRANFSIQEGDRLALIGKSGSGKTTLLKTIAGLHTADQGQIVYGEKDLTHASIQSRNIGFVFQEQALFSALSVLDNAVYGLKMRGASKKDRQEKGEYWLGKVGLLGRAKDPVSILSGGERQRLAFVRALIWKPGIILLDEPFSSLDRKLRDEIRTELLELHKLWPAPMIFVTHDQEDITELATRIIETKKTWTDSGIEVHEFSDET